MPSLHMLVRSLSSPVCAHLQSWVERACRSEFSLGALRVSESRDDGEGRQGRGREPAQVAVHGPDPLQGWGVGWGGETHGWAVPFRNQRLWIWELEEGKAFCPNSSILQMRKLVGTGTEEVYSTESPPTWTGFKKDSLVAQPCTPWGLPRGCYW